MSGGSLRDDGARGASPTAVGVYIFAGGFTLGVREHFDVKAHLEESMYGVLSSLRANPGLEVHVGEKSWPLDRFVGTDFVYCNPPCAPFSQAGATMRGGNDAWKKDPRLRCWRNCFVAFEALQPKVFAVESVVRAVTAARPFVDELAMMANQMGYSATHVLVDAINHGMAQRRKRYFFVAHRVELDFQPPERRERLTVDDLLTTVSAPGYFPPWKDKTHEALMHHLEPGTSFRAMWERLYDTEGREKNAQGGITGRPRIFIHRVDARGSIGTITGDYFVHPTLDRFMGINELKVLNGFPEDYWLEGAAGGQFSLLSRGVCPPVADWLAANIRRGIDFDCPVLEPTNRVVDFR